MLESVGTSGTNDILAPRPVKVGIPEFIRLAVVLVMKEGIVVDDWETLDEELV